MSAAGSTRVGTRTPTRSSAARAARCWSTAAPMGRSTCRACNSPSTAMSCRAAASDKLSRRIAGGERAERGDDPRATARRPRAGTATIATVLDGAVKVVKTDLGTLALSGVNTYTGARRSTAARCRYPRTRTWARLRARCRWTVARWPRPRVRHGARDHGGLGRRRHQCRGGANLRDQRDQRSGALSKGGAGTLTLHADNVYAGGTTITAGTLQLGTGGTAGPSSAMWRTGGTAGSIVGDVANNGALAFNRSDTYTFGGRISAGGARHTDGQRNHRADRRQPLHRPYHRGGHAAIGRGRRHRGIVGDVVNNGSLIVNRGNTYAYGGAISGSGSVTLQGGAPRC